MKKDDGGDWEYLSSYWRRGDMLKVTFSNNERKMFSDNTIKNELAWDAFSRIRKSYPYSKLVLYAEVNGEIVRIKYYNPNAEKRITAWHSPSDFYAYIPLKEYR